MDGEGFPQYIYVVVLLRSLGASGLGFGLRGMMEEMYDIPIYRNHGVARWN